MDIVRAKMNSDEQMCWYCFFILLYVAFIIEIFLFLQYNVKPVVILQHHKIALLLQ
jgi:hypothetical protein